MVADFGYDRAGSYLSGPGRGWLAELDLPPASREIVTCCLAVTSRPGAADRPDRQRAAPARQGRPPREDPDHAAGAGQFTALVVLPEIDDISRFPSARKLASWAGLTPTVRGSDLTVRHGHITRAGLGLAALGAEPGSADRQAVTGIRRAYAAIAKRRGNKIATIAISRKLEPRLPGHRRPLSPGQRGRKDRGAGSGPHAEEDRAIR